MENTSHYDRGSRFERCLASLRLSAAYLFLALAVPLAIGAQAIDFNGTAYTQNFQTITSSALTPASAASTTMLQLSAQAGGGTASGGWYVYQQSGTGRWGRSNGALATGAFYGLYDGAEVPNQALGSLVSSSGVQSFGVVLKNTSGVTINSINITYDAMIARNPSSTVNAYPMSYMVNGFNIPVTSSTGAGTFNDMAGLWINGTGFSTPSTGTGAPGTQLPISPLFRIGGASITQNLFGLGWDNGEYLYIRWKDTDESGSDAMAGVDNFSLSIIPLAITSQPSDRYDCTSNVASFSVSATGANLYQWFRSADNGANWVQLGNGDYGLMSGVTTPTLTASGGSLNPLNGLLFRCVVSDGTNSLASAAARFTKGLPATSIQYAETGYCTTAQPVNVAITGALGGTFSASPAGLSIHASSGQLTPASSMPNAYTILYSVPAQYGCAATSASASVNISNNTPPSISYGADPLCFDETAVPVSLSGATGGMFSALPTGLSINSLTGVINPSLSTAGDYTVTYATTGSMASGCTAYTTTAPVTTYTHLNAVITGGGNHACAGGSYNLTVTGTPNSIVTYKINGGDDLSLTLNASGSTTLVTGPLRENTSYQLVSMRFVDTLLCARSLSSTANITFDRPYLTYAVSAPASACLGDVVNISITNRPFSILLYQINGGLVQSALINNTTGLINIPVTVTENISFTRFSSAYQSAPNCSTSYPDSGAVVILVEPAPAITNMGTTPPSTCSSTDGAINITATGTGPLAYSIDNGGTFQASPSFSGLSVGTYQVKVRNALNCISGAQAASLTALSSLTYYADADGDGYGNPAVSQPACTQPAGYVLNQSDCNDNAPLISPDAPEVCDGLDNNCDGNIDEGFVARYYFDNDGDGYGQTTLFLDACEPTGSYTATVGGDCDDSNTTIYTGAPEICDNEDNDCDGDVDEGLIIRYYYDNDGDGYGNSGEYTDLCAPLGSYNTTLGGDCNDADDSIYPNSPEICDGQDNDCNGSIDDQLPTTRYYFDNDQDGYGDENNFVDLCAPSGAYTSTVAGDCNDSEATAYPDAPEICDGLDNDCDGMIDEGVLTRYYIDSDGDGYGGSDFYSDLCAPNSPYITATGGDCNDNETAVYPGAQEICDGIDNDCNGSVDEGLTTRYYYDFDGDGYGQSSSFSDLCAPTDLYTATVGGDCDDSYATIYPTAPEICDGLDNDCNGSIDEGVTTRYYLDADGDGYGQSNNFSDLCMPNGQYNTTVGGDCNDSDPMAYPTAPEICDGIDNDCNGSVDEGLTTRYYYDFDGDGYGQSISFSDLCAPTDLYTATLGGDCDDSEVTIYPTAPEICDGIDNDCDGSVDEGVTTRYYYDFDGDGYGQSSSFSDLCVPTDLYTATVGGDCDDSRAMVYPDAPEICDGLDNDCNGSVDEGLTTRYYYDFDGDGYGQSNSFSDLCAPTDLYTATVGGDCDDSEVTIYPTAPEICDGIDNDCDGMLDNGTLTTYYRDMDGDGYGQSADFSELCAPTGSYTATVGDDCNDGNASIYPTATEICDGLDNDCDGSVDEGTLTTYYRDMDGDGYGQSADFSELCAPTGSYTATVGGDCDDSEVTIYPTATEICDGLDNDCDGSVDEGVLTTYYRDMDGDGFGQSADFSELCAPSSPYTATVGGDCDDSELTIYPTAPEICDGLDNDCDGSVDEGVLTTYYRDMDGDGYGQSALTQQACTVPTGYVTNNTDCDDNDPLEKPGQLWYKDADGDRYSDGSTLTQCLRPTNYYLASELTATNGDCNDNDDSIYPNAAEICDGLDNDCDGSTDEGVKTTYYADIDGDSYGDANSTAIACAQPQGYVTNNTDCDDADDTVYPGAEEVCDNKDNDCNGATDDLPGNNGSWQQNTTGTATGAGNFPACQVLPQDVFTINSTGLSSPTSDNIQLVYQRLCGNSQITARVLSVSGGGWAGVMMRETLSAGSKKVALKTQLGSAIRREIRALTNGPTASLQFVRPQHVWLRLVRSGSTLTGYTSANGQSWSFAFATTLSMDACIYVGVFSESINGVATNTATFDNVTTLGTPLLGLSQHSPAGPEEDAQHWDIDVYPNPSDGLLQLQLLYPSEQSVEVRVLNTLGEQLKQLPELPAGDSQWSLDLRSLPSGVYYLSLERAGQAPLLKRVVITQN